MGRTIRHQQKLAQWVDYLMDVREPASASKGADTARTLDPYEEAKRPWNIAQLRPYYS